jgi:Mlc titration factor MtfA (ptsG expression regulator)
LEAIDGNNNRSNVNSRVRDRLQGSTNIAAFFAVISEYFVKHPQLLQTNHPGVFDMLEISFKTWRQA